MVRYTNQDSNTLHLNFFSKQVGGNEQCTRSCKKKCKKNCSTFCNIAADDKEEFREAMVTMKKKRDGLKKQLEGLEIEASYKEKQRIDYLIKNSYSRIDQDLLRKLKGGTRKTKRTKSKKGGFSWFENSSLTPCKKSCSDKLFLLSIFFTWFLETELAFLWIPV